MRVHVLHNAVAPDAGPDERDVLVQAEAVAAALTAAGHRPTLVACDLDLATLRRRLEADRPEVAFNLVESLGGLDRLLALVPALLDALEQPYTGTPTAALLRATDKLATKAALAAAGLPVLPCLGRWPEDGRSYPAHDGPVIVKPVWEHGSPWLTDDAVLPAGASVDAGLARFGARHGRQLYAEPYVDGRELNLSLLADGADLDVLPPAEILFDDYPAEKPRIVGYRAKWVTDSFEYRRTPRRFAFPAADRPLLDHLGELSRAAFTALGLGGYARMDFRVDGNGEPYFLEVNANPCLAPDAGFAAAADAAGMPYGDLVGRILDAARDPLTAARLDANAAVAP